MRLMGISEETLDVKQHWGKYAQDSKNVYYIMLLGHHPTYNCHWGALI